MKVVHHAVSHVLIHLALFSGFALLVPSVGAAFEQGVSPWVASPNVFFGGMMLIIVSAFMLYRIKESVASTLQSLGITIFLPGALSVVSSVLTFRDLFENSGISGMSVVQPVADYYVTHSVPTVLSVAAVYLLVGGLLYWAGNKLDRIKSRFSFDS